MAWRIGVDIGGTFTDVALVDDASGRIGVAKVPTTPRDFAAGVLPALRSAMRPLRLAPAEVGLLAHATTVVTNAILEEKGARAALVTTRGFRDVLELRRSARADLYDLFQDPPATLIPRRRRFEITERVGADGAVVTPLAEAEIDGLIAALQGGARRGGRGLAAVQLPQSGARAAARRAAARGAAGRAGLSVLGSAAGDQGVRAHQHDRRVRLCRADPCLLSGAAGARHAQTGLPPLYVMGSNGGVFEAAEAIAMPAMAVESGPAAGVVAAALVARQTGRLDLLSFDMGGTTAKASLIRDGQYETTPEYEVGGGSSGNRWMHGTGHPIRVPVIDLAEVSAGGGSIAWVDRAGALRVGPKSAGAEPGPACYGARRHRADRHRLQPAARLSRPGIAAAGDLPIDHAAARGRGRESGSPSRWASMCATAAAAVIDVVNHAMAEALKIVSVQRGHDPRDFVLAAFGGAGPLHAAALADELGIAEVICPPIPGRLLGARPGRHRPQARLRAHRLHHDGDRRSGGAGGGLRRARSAKAPPCSTAPASRPSAAASSAPSMRATQRQSYELPCRLPARALDAAALAEIAEAFHAPPPRRPTATTTAASRCSSSACASPRSAPSRRSLIRDRPAPPRHRRGQSEARRSGSANRRGRAPRSTIARACRRGSRSRARR